MKSAIENIDGRLTLVIPREFAEAFRLAHGSEVELTVDQGKIVVRPAGSPRYSLADLVAQITDENLHGEIEWGPRVGREVW